MKFSKSCSLILSGCLLAPMLSGCLGGLLGSAKPQETGLEAYDKKSNRLERLRRLNDNNK